MDFQDMDLVLFMRFMSELLQQDIILPSGIREKVTVVTPNSVTISEARKIMVYVLVMYNLSVRDEGIGSTLSYNYESEKQPLSEKIRVGQPQKLHYTLR